MRLHGCYVFALDETTIASAKKIRTDATKLQQTIKRLFCSILFTLLASRNITTPNITSITAVISVSTLHGEYRTEQQPNLQQKVETSNKMSSKNKGSGGRNRRKRARRNDIDLIRGKEFEKSEGQEYAKVSAVLGSGRFKGTTIRIAY